MSGYTFQLPCGCLVATGEFDTTEPCPVHIESNASGEAIMAAFLCDVLRPGEPYPERLQRALDGDVMAFSQTPTGEEP